ncbi:MAG: hypothetical protein RL685_4894 [Pseudomonadota bacterium]|jgi:PAS domain S-box-containing protein
MSQAVSTVGYVQAIGRVWVVDDSQLQTERATRLLAQHYTVESFPDGSALLERLSEGELPDLILLDWQMPGVTGLEVCQFLRERYDEVTLPILMLTARGAKQDFTDGLSAGANDYVAKPYDDAELLARVRGLVRTRQQARALRDREEWFAATLRSIGDGVIATDTTGRITFFNHAAESLTGWICEEAVKHTLEDVFIVMDELSRTTTSRLSGQVSAEGPPSSVVGQHLLVRKDGGTLPVEYDRFPIGAGGQLGSVLTFRDVSARTAAAAEAARRADFEEKLIGIVSHDLRNPLNVISLGTHSLLAGGQLDAPLQRTVRRISASAQSATKLVNDLLDFTQARLGSGIPVRCAPTDLQGVVQQVLDQTQAAYPQRMIVLQVAADTRGEWDGDRVGQALMNLVSNALKYGDASGSVTVRILGAAEGLKIEVHNSGTPIAPQLLPVLFEPMRRGSVPVSDVGRSVGLGLYIVKQIVEAHSGAVTVQSSASEGTTFAMFLPRQAEPLSSQRNR